jgi:glycine betaine/choline ABC-type transport system substrate-binding protein
VRDRNRLLALFAALVLVASAALVSACGDDDEGGTTTTTTEATGQAIQSNPDNAGVKITVGSKNFTEQFILGEIYAQALEAAGYEVKKDLNLGSEQIAFKALKQGDIDGYPEYTSTALTSFFNVDAADVPEDADEAVAQSKADFTKEGLTAFAATPFVSGNAVGLLKTKAEELGVSKVSDLEGKSQDLTLYGSPECRQRIDCLVGLQENYGLKFKKFTPVAIDLRYNVLDKGQADLSIIFTTDARLSTDADKYVVLEEDKQVFPAGNVIFVARDETVTKAGPDMQATVELVQQGLSEEVLRELNARVDVDKETPAKVAGDYLRESGYIQ